VSASTATKHQQELTRSYIDYVLLGSIADLGTSVRLADLAEQLDNPELNANITRVLLMTNSDKFVYADRRWTTAARNFSSNKPINEAIKEIIGFFEGPLSVHQLATQCAVIFGRPVEYYDEIIERVAKSSPDAFVTSSGMIGLREWLYAASDETEENAIYFNNMKRSEIEKWESVANEIDWNQPSAPVEFLKKAKKPVSMRVIGFFAWRTLNPPDLYSSGYYNPVEVFEAIQNSEDFYYGPDGLWYPESQAKKWFKQAIELAEELAPTVEVEEAAPLTVTHEELEQLVDRILSTEDATTVTSLLADVYEVLSDSKNFAEDKGTVVNALKQDERVLWVGGDRFRESETLPPYVHTVPEVLEFPPPFDTEEEIDIELVDEGFSASLRKEISLPLAQDVLDEEIILTPTGAKESEVRGVLMSQHHEIGTFPLSQIPHAFFPVDPLLVELELRDPDGRKLNVWVNYETRLIYGFFEWFIEKEAESGAVFTLKRTVEPTVYKFEWLTDTDPLLSITPNRMEELRNLQARSAEMSVFEIVSDVMERYSKGTDFLSILAEVNVVRRTPRRMVASILSGYHCFFQRTGSPIWLYDAKKLDQGFDKTKRKYIKKPKVPTDLI